MQLPLIEENLINTEISFMDNKAFTINNKDIPWSFYQRVLKLCKMDKYKTALIFFRCAMSNPVSPMAWITKGLSLEGKFYALKPCKQEEHGAGYAKEWIKANIESRKSTRQGLVQFRDCLKGVLSDIENEIQAIPETVPVTTKHKHKELEQLSLF